MDWRENYDKALLTARLYLAMFPYSLPMPALHQSTTQPVNDHFIIPKTIAMIHTPSSLVQLVFKYNALMHRFAMRLTGGNPCLADDIVKEAMEEAYDENIFYDTPQLRLTLKNKVIAKAKHYTSTIHLN